MSLPNDAYEYEWTTYFTQDHLGSTDGLYPADEVDSYHFSYDAYGKRRGTDWSGAPTSDDLDYMWSDSSNRGFTDHEHLDNLGLIHMNGRVYDPTLGRFISADPFVQAPYFSQSLNRYSYAFNNPLAYTDPSGFASDKGPKIPINPNEHVPGYPGPSVADNMGPYDPPPDQNQDWTPNNQGGRDNRDTAPSPSPGAFPRTPGAGGGAGEHNGGKGGGSARQPRTPISVATPRHVPGDMILSSTVGGTGGASLRPMGWRAEFFGYNSIGRVIAKPFDLFAPFGTWVYDGAQVNPLSGLELSPRAQQDAAILSIATGPWALFVALAREVQSFSIVR